MRENVNLPGIRLLRPQRSLYPLNFLSGSHQYPEIAELEKEKSHEVWGSPQIPQIKKLPADLLNVAPPSVHSQRGMFRTTQEQTGASLMKVCSALLWALVFPNGQSWFKSTDLPGHSFIQRFPPQKKKKKNSDTSHGLPGTLNPPETYFSSISFL